jgi:hypothetical protein
MHQLLLAFFVSTFVMAPADVNRTLSNDHFTAGSSVRIDEPVAGDLITGGGHIDVNTNIAGDAVVAGGEVRVRGNVSQGIYAAGGQVLLEGRVRQNARIAGGNIRVGPESEINGNASIAGGDISVDGAIDGYLQAAGGRVYINGPVSGDVEVSAGQVELGPKALIGGRLQYTSHQELKRHPEARVLGEIEKITPAVDWAASHGINGMWIWTLGLMLVAAILVGALPSFYSRVDATLQARFGMSFVIGFVGLVATPLVAVVLFITLIGIPLALLTVALFLALLLVGYITTNVAIGDWALNRFKPERAMRMPWRSGAAALSVLVLGIIGQIPVLGGLVVFAAFLAGIGAIVLQVKRAPMLTGTVKAN